MPATISAKDNSGDGGSDKDQQPEVQVKEPTTLILPDSSKFSSYLFSTFKRSTNALLLILIVLAVPVTMVLLSKPQDVRQRADFQTTPEVTKRYNISGRIYVDTNSNNTRDSWENGPQGAIVLVTGENIKIEVPTDNYGFYSFQRYGGLLSGTYSVSINTIDGYTPIAASTVNIKLGPSDAVVDFGVKKTTNQPKSSL
jgi:hypothetical protein